MQNLAEPRQLSVIRSLSTHLEVLPRSLLPLLRRVCIAKLVLGVVVLNQILDDGAALPDSNAGIRILDGWHTTVWIEAEEWLLLQHIETNGLDLIWNAQLAYNDQDLVSGNG